MYIYTCVCIGVCVYVCCKYAYTHICMYACMRVYMAVCSMHIMYV